MKSSDNIFPKVILAEGAPLATPAAGTVVLYVKADGHLYMKDDAGAETDLTAAGAGAAFTGGSLTSALNEATGASIASAATTNLAAATGNLVHVTGTTTITALGTVQAGAQRTLVFDGVLVLTHGAALILPTAANITTAAGDVAIMRSEGSGTWRCVGYMRASGAGLVAAAAAIVITSAIASGTITPTGLTDLVRPATLTAALTIANPSTAPADGAGFVIDLLDNGTACALTWGSQYATRMATCPTTTTAGKRLRLGFEWNATDSKLYCMYAEVEA